jgi:hypothetical protein
MTLSDCSRALYGLLRIHHKASPNIAYLKSDLLARINDLVAMKYGAETRTYKKDITNNSELLELQRVFQFYAFMYKPDTDTDTDACSGAAGGQFYNNVIQSGGWINEYATQSAIIVKENETSDNSILERKFRTAIFSCIRQGGDTFVKYDVTLSSNTNIQGFDVDIIVTFMMDGKEFIYNCEIDGPHHKMPHKDMFSQLRDRLLLKKNLVHCVRRISLFGDDPRKTKIITKSAREMVVKSTIEHMMTQVEGFYREEQEGGRRSNEQ